MSRVVNFLVALFCCAAISGASGDELMDIISAFAEGPLANLLDSYIDPPPRKTGFETLVPQQNVRLYCTKTSEPLFQEVFFGDVDVTKKINFTLPLTIAIHGWRDNSQLTLYNNLTTRYLKFVKNTNYCLLDWRAYAEFGYQITARRSAPLVAQQLFAFLQAISLLYYPLEKVSLIGFSMGGQIAGLTGKFLPGRLGTIYALDPAGPLFSTPFDIGPTRRIDGTDAKYVQVIYTSRYTVGFGPIVGTQNFLSNKGYHPQPPCASQGGGLTDLANAMRCSHQYAVKLFVDALDPANEIFGQKCVKVLGQLVCWSSIYPKDRLGVWAKRISGNFYLN
uniref:Lipase domain-containing protein n=1 Tax=Anopheles dirus TaxID=7168 RepID=A0A182N4Z1_9DIPT